MALCSIAIAAGVIGVVAVMKRIFFYRRFGEPMGFAACGPSLGGGCGGGHEQHWRARRWGGPGRSFWLRALFAKLDTTPGQEREIRAAIEDFQTTAKATRGGLVESRTYVARAIAGDSFDEIAAGEASTRADDAVRNVKEALATALKRVHAVLDPKQRERLAELLEKGPGFGRRWGNPYRDDAH